MQEYVFIIIIMLIYYGNLISFPYVILRFTGNFIMNDRCSIFFNQELGNISFIA